MMSRSIFIALEGCDGAGKSMQAEKIAKYLSEVGFDVFLTREPSDSCIGRLIRKELKKKYKIPPEKLQLLFVTDRLEHLVNEIEPKLKEGKIVICDRYILSSLAYGSLYVDLPFLKRINSYFRWPDVTIILDVPAEECIKRIRRSKSHVELFERVDLLKRVRNNYIFLAKQYPNVHVVDGNRPKEIVFENIKNILKKYFKSTKELPR